MLQKETVTFNFAQGLDTFSDPNQLPMGKFLSLSNAVFIKASSGNHASLQKRNGYGILTSPLGSTSFITTYNDSLIGVGLNNIESYSSNAQSWTAGGFFQPLIFSNQSIVKNAYNQSNVDGTLSNTKLYCTAFASGIANTPYQYAIYDSETGQSVLRPSTLPTAYVGQVSSTGQVVGVPRVFSVGSSFFIVYGTTATSTAQLIVTQVSNYSPYTYQTTALIDQNLLVTANPTLNNYNVPVSRPIFDGAVGGDGNLYVTFCSSRGPLVGAKLTSALGVSTASFVVGSQYASCLATVVDQTSSAVYTITSSAYGLSYVATNFGFTQLFSPVAIGVSSSSYVFPGNGSVLPWGISNLTGYAANGNLTSFYEPYSQATGLQFGGNSVYMDKICVRTMSQSGSPGSETVIAGSLGIGSKAFSVNGQICLIGAFQSQLQNSYFLINTNGAVLSRIAYGNGGGYYPLGAPSVSVIGSTASFAYLFKDFVQSRSTANLTLSSASLSGQSGNIYTQTGINFGEFTFSGSNQSAKELGGVLNLNGGFLWTFDSLQATENNFFLYPEGGAYSAYGAVSSAISQMTSGQQYNYVGVYEWTDNQANIHQSAPSLAVSLPALTTSSSVGVQVTMPVLRTTNRVSSNPVALALYRSSTQQPTFYRMGSVNLNGQIQTASITSYLSVFVNGSNNLDTVSFFDTSSDSFILGNKILYTTGGVLEDSAGPPAIAMAIWDSRLWLISAEDGTLWYSKIVIPSTPVEMSQFQTIYVPNAQGAQGSSGLPKCLFAMNDKLIIFKKNMLFFINGTGPDATGANSQYSDPIQIPSGVGCENQASVVLTPVGLMFQSDNGIWLLGQDLSLRYVGKDVEDYNSSKVLAATCVPGTSEVRFEMDNGIKLVYDYLVDQWATFSISGQSSVIYGNKHTFLNGAQVYQETPNVYSDGAVPVTLSFQTGWFNLSGLQGYQRAYFMELLGNFYSPHTFQTNIAYNYNSAIAQSVSVNPSNVVGSGSSVEQWEIGFQQQQCQSFQISFQETASASAGAGLTLSGIGLTYGRKKTWPRNIPIPNRTG